MPGYMVCWPQDRWKEIKKAGDTGPIKVVYGSIHARMPTIASIQVGDVVFPVTYMQKHLYVMARLPVTHRERAFDYCMRELGTYHSALPPKGVVMEMRYASGGGTFFSSWDCKSYNCLEAVPQGAQIIPLSTQVEKPHLEHQNPFNCCSQWAVWGEEGSSIEPRQLPDEVLPDLRFGYPKSKEKPLKFTANGSVLSSSLTATRRMSEETLAVFESLLA
ncbi:MAG: hypothetical protein HFF50_04815 [Lawsonibacter sp.]|nr:hypothetical protein [Lawsonibacter sp.]